MLGIPVVASAGISVMANPQRNLTLTLTHHLNYIATFEVADEMGATAKVDFEISKMVASCNS